jgi:adenylate cyclase class 2
MSGECLEIEVKFLVEDPAALRRRLVGLGATVVRPRIYERNVRYDDASQSLRRQGKLLRLRQDAAAILTYKGNPAEHAPAEVRVREEIETEVADFETMDRILRRVGFEPQQIYEKYREAFTFEGVEVVLDELPFGHFVELEGEAPAIRRAADRLGLDWERRILANYLGLMARVQEALNLPFEDLTFANFAGREVRWQGILE